MSLHSHDQDLLLLAHKALPAWRKLSVQVHVVVCARCRERLAEMETVSVRTAAALRGSEMPFWPLPYPGGTLRAARTATAWLTAFGILLVLSVGLFSYLAHTHLASLNKAKQRSLITHGGCRPDLPNDKCQ